MNEKIKNIFFRGGAIIVGVALLIAVFKYALPVLLPFVLAYLISAGVRPLSGFLSKKTKISKKIWSVILIILSAAVLGFLLWFVGSTLVREIKEVLSSPVKPGEGSAVQKISDKMTLIFDKAKGFDIDVSKMQSTAISKAT